MKSAQVIDVKMANKQRNWFVFFYVSVNFIDGIASVKDNITILAVYKNTRSISRRSRVPAVGTQEINFHAGAEGIEPSSKVLETSILPLNYTPLGAPGQN